VGSAPASPQPVTFYTVSDEGFFLGTVMLLNSLRLTGAEGKLVVLDAGLSPRQREALERHAEVTSPPRTIDGTPCVMKPYPFLVGASGVVVVIDSDIVVTGRLDDVVTDALEGRIVAAPAWTEAARRRFFPQWEQALALRAPLRRHDWFHNGFVVLSTDHWPDLLRRWWEVCELVPPDQAFADDQPFNAPDADALNALLMSEIPREALALLRVGDEVFGGDVAIVDAETLDCRVGNVPARLLHYPDSPKPWQGRGWARAGVTAYAKLMRRLLFEADLPLQVDPADVPIWFRPTPRGRLTFAFFAATAGVFGRLTGLLPPSLQNHLRDVRRAALGTRPKLNLKEA
jgi:hypothetical protein